MQKKYLDVAARLRRYINDSKLTIEEWCEENDLSADSIRNGYLSGRSLPGGELLRKLILAGVDVRWLLTGLGGIPPNPSREEMESYVNYLQKQLDYWQKSINIIDEAWAEAHQKRRDALGEPPKIHYRLASEPKQSHIPKGGEE